MAVSARLKPRATPARRGRQADGWQRYEAEKAEFMRKYPGATPAEYARAMREAAKKAGV